MQLILSRQAGKAILQLPKQESVQLRERLKAIAAAPEVLHAGVTALQGAPAGRFRVRQGDWRAVFRFDGDTMVVDRIGHRREVYD